MSYEIHNRIYHIRIKFIDVFSLSGGCVSDFKQQLEAMRDRMADEIFYKNRGLKVNEYIRKDSQYSKEISLAQAGFNAAIPIILEMAETLHGIKNAKSSGADVYAFADATKFDAEEALNKLKQFVVSSND